MLASSYAAPVGFDGEQRMTAFVLGVSALRSCSGVIFQPSASVVGTMTGVPPTSRTCSG